MARKGPEPKDRSPEAVHGRKVDRYKAALTEAEQEEVLQQVHDELGVEYPHPPGK